MSDVSQRLQAALQRLLQGHDVGEPVLNAGASETDFTQLEQLTQTRLPEDFKAVYRVFNGQADVDAYVFDGEEWLSLARMAEEWEVWKDLLDNDTFSDGGKAFSSDAETGIKPVWWSDKWLPFTYDGAGNHLCLDLDPTAEGTYGQVIRMWHDDAERSIEASSFAAWLGDYVAALESGQYVYSDDYGGIVNSDDIIDEDDD